MQIHVARKYTDIEQKFTDFHNKNRQAIWPQIGLYVERYMKRWEKSVTIYT